MERLLDACDELGVRSVIFSGGGEPLAWNAGRFGDCLRSRVGYRRGLATNGLGVMRELGKELLSRLDIIQININGYDEESFSWTTGTRLFSEFLSNMKWLFGTRDPELTQVSGKILLNRQNYKIVDQYLEFCSDFDFDLLIIKLAGNFEMGQDVELTEVEKCELSELLVTSPFVKKYRAKLDGITVGSNTMELPLPEKCWTIELGLYVLVRSNGDVFPCVVSPYTPENRLGNIYKTSLQEMWESQHHRKIKSKLHRDMVMGACKLNICRHLRYNFVIAEALTSAQARESIWPLSERPKLL